MDIVDPATRSRMMSGIRGKDTKPELVVRKALFKLGHRYILHDSRLPGRPDLVLPKYKAAIFVNGCFWHAHECSIFKWPGSRQKFWKDKILANRKRDCENISELEKMDWRILVVWECFFRGKSQEDISSAIAKINLWLKGDAPNLEIAEPEAKYQCFK